jgi:predicted dipeptidase
VKKNLLRAALVQYPLLVIALAATSAQGQNVSLHAAYEKRWAPRLVPMLAEVVRFPTYAGNAQAFADQGKWLERTARELDFRYRDAGPVTEIELPGPPYAPVLGLLVHGDVVPVDKANWTFPPFEAEVKDGMVLGRGTADDKGPLIQALVAMKVLQESGKPRTHTIRLLVGSDEETGSSDMRKYLATHKPPDLSLVLDSSFPVVVGEMSGNTLLVDTKLTDRGPWRWKITSLASGIASNIIPDLAMATIEAAADAADELGALRRRLEARPLPTGTRVETELSGSTLIVRARGKAAHAGVNPLGGRNALVALATALGSELPPGGARDLLEFAKLAGRDTAGSALGFTESHPMFGRMVVAPTMLRTSPDGSLRLWITIRSYPGMSSEPLKDRTFARVRQFNADVGASLQPGGTFTSQPLVHDPASKIVRRLLAAYARAVGKEEPPAISAGGTYAKAMPNAIVYGMWFPGKPYPGHDVDEKISIEDLHMGVHALLEAISDIACGEPMEEPFEP